MLLFIKFSTLDMGVYMYDMQQMRNNKTAYLKVVNSTITLVKSSPLNFNTKPPKYGTLFTTFHFLGNLQMSPISYSVT